MDGFKGEKGDPGVAGVAGVDGTAGVVAEITADMLHGLNITHLLKG